MFYAYEGADGCGKNTIADAVAEVLQAERLDFPNDAGVTGPSIRSYLRKEWGVMKRPTTALDKWTGALALQSMMLVNRLEVYPRLVLAKETDRHLVIARYWQSGWVYGQLDGLSPDWLYSTHAVLPKPTCTFFLDVPAEVCMERRARRDGDKMPEIYEGKLAFTQKVVDLYRSLFKMLCINDASYAIIDGTQPIDVIVAECVAKARAAVYASHEAQH